MKFNCKIWNPILISSLFLLVSCFKKEAPNAECDILEAYIHVGSRQIEDIFYHPSDTLVRVDYSANEINFTIKQGADLTRLSPEFTLTPGATISPESGSMQDFSKGKVRYTVTSEDKEWQREYFVSFSTASLIPFFEFEHFKLEPNDKKYYVWETKLTDGSFVTNWASGNAGYTMGAPKEATPEDYPDVPVKGGVNGYALKLTTLSTGALGKFARKPIAGGSLWLGKFDMSKSLTDPMKSINFGVPFDRKPLKISGYYKYQPGPAVTDRDMNEIPGAVDQPDIYAILFKNHDSEGNPICLYSDNSKTSPQLVAIAQVENFYTTAQWLQFEAEFEYIRPLDPKLLRSQGYSFSIMFNSSAQGDIFYGAVGSTLEIDSVKVTCED